MDNLALPEKLEELLSGYTYEKNEVGCTSAHVYHYQKGEFSLYLKMEKTNEEIRREHRILNWLEGRLPVPQVKYYQEYEGLSYLLMTRVAGHMACECPEDVLCQPYERTVKRLAEGLLMLQTVDISDCPFENTLEMKLQKALRNIQNNLVDINDFEEGNDFESPMELYQWLVENKPAEELHLTHGDYCLPNIFIDDKQVTGFIDVGDAGIADKWQDIALCIRSLGYNLRDCDQREQYVDLLFQCLGITPDWVKIDYYVLLDELF